MLAYHIHISLSDTFFAIRFKNISQIIQKNHFLNLNRKLFLELQPKSFPEPRQSIIVPNDIKVHSCEWINYVCMCVWSVYTQGFNLPHVGEVILL